MERIENNVIRYVPKKTGTDNIAIPEPVQKPQPPCPLCLGMGFTRVDVPVGHDQSGKAIACACKLLEQKHERNQQLMEQSGIANLPRFRKATFETFDQGKPDVRNAYRHARQFAMFPSESWLVLTGPCGCGKTHLAAAIAKERLKAGDIVVIQTVPDLLDRLRNTFAPSVEQSYDELFQQMKDADVLILDDYGAEQSTGWANEKMFQLFNHRYNKSLPTVVTSNNIHLSGIDQRIYSRLHDQDLVTLVKMEGARDYRSSRADGREHDASLL